MLCGILDKSQLGSADYGIVHSVYDLYGPEVAGKFLGILSRLFTKFLQHRAFTCRMDDLAMTKEGEKCRKVILSTTHDIGTFAAIDNFPSLASVPETHRQEVLQYLLNDVLRDDQKMVGLDITVKKHLAAVTKSITDACMPHELKRRFPFNHMQMMTQSGAKGSAVNAQQISCVLGQQELEGRRVPVMVSGKTLPSFKAFETAAVAVLCHLNHFSRESFMRSCSFWHTKNCRSFWSLILWTALTWLFPVQVTVARFVKQILDVWGLLLQVKIKKLATVKFPMRLLGKEFS